MGATTKPTRTWAAAAFRKEKESEFGSFVPDSGRYPLISATIVNETSLRLTVAGSSEITDLGATYGDGSGELYGLIERLDSLSSNHDISSIITLLRSVILRSRIDLKTIPLNDIKDIQAVSGTRYGNAISSVLRSTFSGWYRRIVIAEKVAFLAWIPFFSSEATYSLLWLTSEIDEWAVVVEGPLTRCKKAGVAFVGGLKPVGSKAVVTIL
ncbi:hypothetical protein B0H14DRAFT_858271 [Mycena olivaceomarginata]|nr:hypothetical protein B0H14DRAFT_858271 [Mycena olivaceomarginata]